MGFNLEDYEPVEERLKKFWADHPDWSIKTDLESPVENIDEVVFVAMLINEKRDVVATGWASEIRGEGYVNKTSHLENCETSAIGRALANLGYQGSKRPSREEMEKVQRSTKKDDVRQDYINEIGEIMKADVWTEQDKETVRNKIGFIKTNQTMKALRDEWQKKLEEMEKGEAGPTSKELY